MAAAFCEGDADAHTKVKEHRFMRTPPLRGIPPQFIAYILTLNRLAPHQPTPVEVTAIALQLFLLKQVNKTSDDQC